MVDIFYDNGNLNKNRLQENWVKKNIKEYPLITQFAIDSNFIGLKYSQILYNYYNGLNSLPLCNLCNLQNKRFLGFKLGYDNFCSKKCAAKYSKNDSILKRKENTIKKYGVAHTSQLDKVKIKQKETNIKKYGFISPTLNEDVRNKQINTMLDKYGVKYSGENDILLKKSIKSREKNYLIELKNSYPDLNIKVLKEGLFEINCNNCKLNYNITSSLLYLRSKRYNINPCLNCNPLHSYKYNGENELISFLNQNNIKIETKNRKILNGKELDIFLPEFNIAIEFNGLYWHSELFKEKDYHFNKKENCEKLGINLIFIWEDDWLYKKDIILSRLKSILNLNKKIYARKCIIKKIENSEYINFLKNNHIQGKIYAKYKIGLFLNDELKAVMSFGKLRKSLGFNKKDDSWELYRYCSSLNTNIVGGFSKMLSYFENEIKPNLLISYANRDWTSIFNNVYDKNNFSFISKTPINYFYFKNDKKSHRFKFNKFNLIKQGFDKNKTEKEIMKENGFFKIYGCGNLKFEKKY
jgi:hypothetical protein